jgi:uncharacterized Ntn-hydrolase superfamily protein
MVDAQGRVASHTGTKCIAESGYYLGPHYSVQANIMLKDTVWDAMAKAYENATGDLAERMLQALEAAQAEGGDLRGRQSAALLIVSGEPTGIPWKDRLFDLQIADHPTPLKELRRLVKVARAYHHMDKGDEYLGLNKIDKAMAEYQAAAKLVPDNVEMRFWHAATLASIDKVEESLPIFAKVFKEEPIWREMIPRLVKAELLPAEATPKILAIK